MSKFVLVCFVLIQLSQARNYTYFTQAGEINYSYAQKLRGFNAPGNQTKLTDNSQESSNDYKAKSLQFFSAEDISQMDPYYVYQSLNWLNPSKYPLH